MTTSRADAAHVRASTQLPFASCYVFSPTGGGPISVHSRRLRDHVKSAEQSWIALCAARVSRQCQPGAGLEGFFHAADVLVPLPGRKAGAVSREAVTRQLAERLMESGLGCSVWAGLARIVEVPKSATAPRGARPDLERQFESLGVVCAEGRGSVAQFMLIDDVVSRGRTMLAAAMRLREAFPRSRVRGFALLRTLGMTADVDRLLHPCIGTIRLARGDARREP